MKVLNTTKCCNNKECGDVEGLNSKMTPRAIMCANVNLRSVGGNPEKKGQPGQHDTPFIMCACGQEIKKSGGMSKCNNHTHCNSMSYAI